MLELDFDADLGAGIKNQEAHALSRLLTDGTGKVVLEYDLTVIVINDINHEKCVSPSYMSKDI